MDELSSHTISRKDFFRQSALSLAGYCLLPYSMQSKTEQQIFRIIPSTGESLPVIGMGSWLTFDVGASPAERAPMRGVLQAFAAAGGKVIDSSPMYGKSEKVIGQLAHELKLTDNLWVATKIWTHGEQSGISQIDTSVKLFKKQPSLLQVHNLVDLNTHLKTLNRLKQEGQVKYIGVTHYVNSAHEDLARIIKTEKVDFMQINLSVSNTAAEDELLPLAADKGVAVIINQPFHTGALFRTVKGIALPEWVQEWGISTWAGFFLKYIISHPAVTCVIPATRQVAHVKENMAAGYTPLPDVKTRKKMADYFKSHAR